MRRRDFVTLLGGAAATWPLAARAQQPAAPLIGLLQSGSVDSLGSRLDEFQRGLNGGGYFEGRNVAVEYRWAEGKYDRLPALAADLVRRQPAVIFATPAPPALAAKAASTTIPIVFAIGNDPVKIGLVASFNHPGGNATGISWQGNILAAKQFELLHEVVSTPGLLGLLVNPNGVDREADLSAVQAAADALGRKLLVVTAASEPDLRTAFAKLAENRAVGVSVNPDNFLTTQRATIVALAARHAIPAVYFEREFVDAGGLISYGADRASAWRQAGAYVARVLKGEKPADLPVVQPTKFDLVLNSKTAKALGITFPVALLATADEVIE
jgi:putative tryptophan/tyrosine transport system substrate-binding protein